MPSINSFSQFGQRVMSGAGGMGLAAGRAFASLPSGMGNQGRVSTGSISSTDIGKGSNAFGPRVGAQGEMPLTGIKGLGSTGGLRESSMKGGYSKPISGGGMRGNAGVSSGPRIGGTGAGGGMRGGMTGGAYGLGGGADFGKIY
jgi:hypothetical protein